MSVRVCVLDMERKEKEKKKKEKGSFACKVFSLTMGAIFNVPSDRNRHIHKIQTQKTQE